MGCVIHFFGWGTAIFIDTLIGQQLIDKVKTKKKQAIRITYFTQLQNERMHQLLFHLNWCDKDKIIKSDLNFIQMRTNRAPDLKLLGFGAIGLQTFTAVIMTISIQIITNANFV